MPRATYRHFVRTQEEFLWKCRPCSERQPPTAIIFNASDSDNAMDTHDVHNHQDSSDASRIDDDVPDRPPPLAEQSIDESEPQPQENDSPDEISFKFIEKTSEKGKDKVFDSVGYSYIIRKKNKNGSAIWRCPVRNKDVRYCPATVIQIGSDFTAGLRGHVHPPSVGIAAAAELVSIVKDAAVKEPFKSAAKIVEDFMGERLGDEPIDALPKVDHMIHTANRHRQRTRPKDPQDLDFELVEEHLPAGFFREDIKVRGKRHLLFASDCQLKLLATAKTW